VVKSFTQGVIVAAASASCLLLTAGQSVAATSARHTAPTAVAVTAGKPTEYEFKLSPKSIKHGIVLFTLTNLGKLPHGFTIDGQATKVIKPHHSTTLTVDFKKPGRYVYQCSEPHVDPTQENVDQDGNAGPCGGGILKVT
jgi:uncharacterized cupredoxin-like copper-binding protein